MYMHFHTGCHLKTLQAVWQNSVTTTTRPQNCFTIPVRGGKWFRQQSSNLLM